MAQIASATREQDICVFIGRFQILHAGHLGVIMKALACAEHLIIIVGSANIPRRPDTNPFFASEREEMIRGALPREALERISILQVEDSDNFSLTQWTERVNRLVTGRATEVSSKLNPKIALIGHAKDNSSFYLKLFPQWDSIDVISARPLDARDIRAAYFSNDSFHVEEMFRTRLENGDLPVSVNNWLRDFQKTDAYGELVEETEFCRKARHIFDTESYPGSRNTVTSDALIVQSSRVLMIRRNQYPFKGCWALPGGHLNIDETIMDCALREGYEETGIKVPRIIFEKSFVSQYYADTPNRDPRGRYISHTFMFHLQPTIPQYDTTKSGMENKRRIRDALALPRVKGMDDADKAKWIHLSDLDRSKIAFDHYQVIRKMTADLKEED